MKKQLDKTSFATYYKTKFKKDLNRFFETIPDQSKFHEDPQNKEEFSIQFERLARDFDYLNFLSKDEKINFGVALFFTVLIDMVCYTHFKEHYNKFRKLTRYPKLIGSCPGGCYHHFPPDYIFRAMNHTSARVGEHILASDRLDFSGKFQEAIVIMEKETKDFFAEYLTEIDEQKFWISAKQNFPL